MRPVYAGNGIRRMKIKLGQWILEASILRFKNNRRPQAPPPREGWFNDLPPVSSWSCICPERRRNIHRHTCPVFGNEDRK